jgi:hypothetical protein
MSPSEPSRSDHSHACPTPGRRRTRPALRSPLSRARDACHHPSRDRGGSDARPTQDPHDELEAFAHWFADWWLRRGRALTSTHNQGEHDE